MKTGEKVGLGAAIAGLGAGIIYALTKGREAEAGPSPRVAMSWDGAVAQEGGIEFAYGSTHRLTLTVTNPTSVPWTYDIQWYLSEAVKATWRGITVQPGESVNLAKDILFGPSYQPGDANGDGVVNMGDVTTIELMIAGLIPETPGADANQDGVVNMGDVTTVEQIIGLLIPLPPIVQGVVPGSVYSSSVRVTEESTQKSWQFDFNTISIAGPTVGTLQITSVPDGASVYINEGLAGVAPLTQQLSPGTYQIKGVLDGYSDWLGTAQVVAGETTSITLQLIPLPDVAVSLGWDGGAAPPPPPPPPPAGVSIQLLAGYQTFTYTGPDVPANQLLAPIVPYLYAAWFYDPISGTWPRVDGTDTIIRSGVVVGVQVSQACVLTY